MSARAQSTAAAKLRSGHSTRVEQRSYSRTHGMAGDSHNVLKGVTTPKYRGNLLSPRSSKGAAALSLRGKRRRTALRRQWVIL
jgi:hypothetical protein